MWQKYYYFQHCKFLVFYPKYLIPLFHHLVSNRVNIKSRAANFFFTISYFITTVRKIKAIFKKKFASGASHDFRNLFFISIDGL